MSKKEKEEMFEEEFMDEFTGKDRSRANRRKQDARKARRKKRISEEVYDFEWYDNLHEYSKGKVHCSCPMCSGLSKTNSKKVTKGGGKPQPKPGRRFDIGYGTTNHRHGKNWSVADLRKLEALGEE